jgi:hypothetical protein
VSRDGILPLLLQCRIQAHGHEVPSSGDGRGNPPGGSLRQGPLHHVPEDLPTFSAEGLRQILQRSLRLRIEAGLGADTIAPLAWLRFR